MNIRLLLTPLLASLAASASAVERYWDGGDATVNMTAAANWDGNTALNLANDDLNFPTGVAAGEKTASNNYAANTVFRTLNFLDSGYTVNGTIMATTNGVTGLFATGGNTINASFAINNSQSFAVNGGGDLTLAGQIFVNGTSVLNLQPIHADSVINVDGIMFGTGTSGLRITGDGTVNINGSKDFHSNLTIENGGELNIDNNGGLGSTTGVTTIHNGTLILDSAAPLTIPESFRLIVTDPDETRIISRGGAHTLSGPFELSGEFAWRRFLVEGSSLTLSGPISGNPEHGSFGKLGPGKLILAGSQSNTSTIQIFNHLQGETLLQKTGGALAISCPYVHVGPNSPNPNSVVLRLGASHQIIDTARVDLGADGLWDLAGFSETVAELQFRGGGHVTVGAGTLRLTAGVDAFSAAQNGGNAVITGPVILESPNSEWEVYGGTMALKLTSNGAVSSVAPGGVLTKTGGGVLELNGNHSIPQMNVTDGSVILSGNSPNTAVNVNISTPDVGEGLDATGTVGDLVLESGSFGYGKWDTMDELTCKNLSMKSAARYYITFKDSTPGQHDVIHAKGTVQLEGSHISLSFQGPPAALGDECVIIDNDGTDPVQGQFSNAAEGAFFFNNYIFSYKGGDGNDVSLTYIIPPTGVTRTWDGGGADDNWMTANNWNPNLKPNPGDDLFFPVVALRKFNDNNFPAGTAFNSITVAGEGYGIGGNQVTLNSKFEFTSPTGSGYLGLPLALAQDVTLSVTGDMFLQAGGAVTTNGHTFILENKTTGAGDIYYSGVISGTGGLRKIGPGDATCWETPHTYTGVTNIEQGTLSLNYLGNLGATGAQSGTVVAAGATLELQNSPDAIVTAETITLAGRIVDSNGPETATVNGPLICVGNSATIESVSNKMSVNGLISGTVLHKTGAGSILIAGTVPNTLNGGMFVDEGQLVLDNSVPNAFACPVIIGNANLPAKVTYGGDNQIADNTTVQIVHPSGILEIGANTDTINALVMNGGTVTGTPNGRLTLQTLAVNDNAATAVVAVPIVRAAAGGILQVGNGTANPDLRMDAAVYGTAFEKQGPGRVDFMTAIPTEGLDLLKVSAGHALFFANSRYTNIELAGGTVGGSGVVGNITSLPGGFVSPGTDTSPGGLGIYTSTWNAATTLRIEINGTNPGGEFDQIAAFAPLNLGSAKLTLTVPLNYEPAAGTEFMIVRNVSGQPVASTFAGAPEGGYVSAPGAKVFRISYHGGDGDDVVLTRVDTIPPVIVEHGMTPGTGEHKGENDTHLVVKGMPGLAYQLEHSSDLTAWNPGAIKVADLQTGLMEFEFFNPETDPRLFLRARLP